MRTVQTYEMKVLLLIAMMSLAVFVYSDAVFSQLPASVTSYGLTSADGFMVHPFKLERGVLLDDELAKGDRRWLMQHVRELAPTQLISRGSGAVVPFERDPMDVDSFNAQKFESLQGEETTIGDWLGTLTCDAILVLRGGRIVNEQYFHGMTPDRDHVCYSMSKSLTATMLATLLGEQLQEDGKIEAYVPMLTHTAFEGARVQDLLDMKSAVEFTYFAKDPTADTDMQRYQDALRATDKAVRPRGAWEFLSKLRKADQQHGALMRYKEVDVAALALAAESVSGKRFVELFSERIWSKLGMEHDAYVRCDGTGQAAPSFGISATLRDIGRWGQMCLQNGQWQGCRIVPEEFYLDLRRFATEATPQEENTDSGVPTYDGARYHNLFWMPKKSWGEGAFCASGGMGQVCYVSPQHNVVVAMFCSWPEHTKLLTELQWHGCGQIAMLLGNDTGLDRRGR
jgi:CubicO group peptidase (beta-lactamase class C family)